jgi:hypothetical protein
MLAGSYDADLEGSCSASSSGAAAAAAGLGWVPDRPGEPCLADLSTLSALLSLQPEFLLSHLPPEMHAMGGSLAAALQAAQRLVAVAGDRGSLLVAQDLSTAVGAVVGTGKGCSAAADIAGGAGSNSGAGGRGALAQQWLQRALEEGAHGLQQLLPNHACLNSAAALDESAAAKGVGRSLQLRHDSRHDSSSSSSGSGGAAQELDDDQVLLMRVQQLAEWAGSQQYQAMMAAARPLRRVVQRGRAPSA